jgi:hypothetical protein
MVVVGAAVRVLGRKSTLSQRGKHSCSLPCLKMILWFWGLFPCPGDWPDQLECSVFCPGQKFSSLHQKEIVSPNSSGHCYCDTNWKGRRTWATCSYSADLSKMSSTRESCSWANWSYDITKPCHDTSASQPKKVVFVSRVFPYSWDHFWRITSESWKKYSWHISVQFSLFIIWKKE